MFYILSKSLFYLAMPMTWLLILLVLALAVRSPKLKRWSIRLALVIILVFGNRFLGNELMTLWEKPARPLSTLPAYDVGIVLTGVVNNYKTPRDRTYFLKGADRITHALQLYKAKKIKKILITGGLYGREDIPSEAANLRSFLLMAGVPEQDIVIEEKAFNTHQNALYSSKILQQRFPNQKYLLITSAFHMRRAQACFAKEGVQADLFPSDFYTKKATKSLDYLFLPSEKGLYVFGVLVHEVVGYVVYKLVGYA